MSARSSAVGFGGVADAVGIVFVVLKLTDVVHWGWVWVLSPFWIPLGLIVLVVLLSPPR